MPCAASACQVVGLVVASENAAVDLGVQRLHAAIHHLGKAGVLGHVADRQPASSRNRRVPPVLYSFDSGGREPGGESEPVRASRSR